MVELWPGDIKEVYEYADYAFCGAAVLSNVAFCSNIDAVGSWQPDSSLAARPGQHQ